MSDILQRLKERKLVQWALAYAAAAFALLQGVDIVAQRFVWPESIERTLIVAVAIGFFATLILAWYHGEKGAQRISGTELLILALLLAVGGGLMWRVAKNPGDTLADRREVAAAPVAAQTAPAPDKSIAVLPFLNMSSDKEQEYFSDGLSEELLNQLAQIPQLRVIARTSSFSFKGKEVDVATIAKVLGVAHVLEGSVRKSANTLRITAQLIRTSDSSHLWSNTYDRDLTDVFKVQDEISREVVSALKLQLLPGKLPDNTQHTRNPAAYEQYLIGKEAGLSGRAAVMAALAAFEHAVALDPSYANAYAELAATQASVADFAENPAQREAVIDQALATAGKAIALAPDLPDGYATRGNTRHRMRWDWQGSQADLARAIALDPNNARTLSNYGPVLFSLGRRDEAIALLRKAVASDPLSDNAWNVLGRHLHAAGVLAEAKQAFVRALEINPNQNWGNFLLGNILLAEGKTDLAMAHYQRAPEQFRAAGTAMAEFTRGNETASLQALAIMEKNHAIGFAFQIAEVYAWRGDKDRAFAWLDRAYDIHDAGMVRLPYDPAVDPLRDDPRFAALVRKMGFPK
jgi:TolB-like protein/tetratricopeptide (TPR) repeat protein